uniref:Ubiquitin hydrolase n=1 Tax=Tanacetum cinerariifolium TaxID=118510 RepID=A0A699HT94_TANCI|nr:ubiquitin hydrolase [Tanacetum cinerariifolium]
MAFISSAKHNSGNKEVNIASGSTASINVSTASANIRVASISQDTAYAYIASQFSASHQALIPLDVETFGGKVFNLRPSPAIESTSDDAQNRNPSVTETEASPSTISPKPFIKFVKAADCTKVKTNKVEAARKSSVRYAEMYRRTSKSPNVRGNQRNWNNLKSQQLGNNFVMKNKACFNCGDFDNLSYDCGLWVKKRRACSKNNYTHKSMPPRAVVYKTVRPPIRTTRPNMNTAQPKKTFVYRPAYSYLSRPVQRKSAVRTQSQVPRVFTVCCCCSRQVNTARPKAVINRRNWVNNIKASACWV